MKADLGFTAPHITFRGAGYQVKGRNAEVVSCTCGKLQCVLDPVPMGTGIDLKYMKEYRCLGSFSETLAVAISAVKGGREDETKVKTALFGMENVVHVMNGIRHERIFGEANISLTDTGE